MESIRGIDNYHGSIFKYNEVTIFELFFRGLLRRRYSSPIFYIAIYIGVVSLIYGINSLGNSKLNLIANILIYYAVYSLLYEEEL